VLCWHQAISASRVGVVAGVEQQLLLFGVRFQLCIPTNCTGPCRLRVLFLWPSLFSGT
jgi:hypothetical protein